MPDQDLVVVGDFAYSAVVRRRGARASEERWFSETAPFRIPAHADGDPVPPLAVIAADRRGQPLRYRATEGGGLLREGLAPDALASVMPARSVAYFGQDKGFPEGRFSPRVNRHAAEDRLLLRASVVTDDRAGALARATDLGARALFLDGTVWYPAEQPVLALDRGSGLGSALDYTPGDAIHPFSLPFHVCDLDEAVAYAEGLRGHPWIGPMPHRINPPAAAIEIPIAPNRDAFVLLAARTIFSRLAETDLGRDFSALPIEALDAWVRFRRAAGRVEAGSLDAVSHGYTALGDLLDTMPDLVRSPSGKVESASEQVRYKLEEPVRHWRTYLARLVPEPAPEADVQAVAALAR